uniref:Uncharacterized protein n=1 Tax=viral metagenome TaxID=1070528 RepID=A0A6M3J697_9ZZZZ
MTQEGMRHLQKGLTLGYLVSKKSDRVYILVDDMKTIVSYHRDYWKAYHVEESHLY